MTARYFKVLLFIFIPVFLFITKSYSQTSTNERHIGVSMRMIGHQILLNAGDSTSRVLAVEKELDRYKIEFEADFQLNTEKLVTTVNQIVKKTKIASSYLVEVEECDTKKVIYAYEIDNTTELDFTPCLTRIQPKACYKLFVTILNPSNPIAFWPATQSTSKRPPPSIKPSVNSFIIVLQIIPFFILTGLLLYFWKKKQKLKADSKMILIGKYQFDKTNRILSFENKKTELSSKESDLLSLLYNSTNTVLEREYILKIVWGDEGNYIGRTLDVFISKLRKKLAADSNLKIINIRGVGYKFMIDTV